MKYSLFIGRWQGFHAGHKALLETELNVGNPVLVAIRDTPKDEKNPFTVEERTKMIQEGMKEWIKKGMVKIMPIPDISAVVYGRDVGYEIREVKLPKEIEDISGTETRKQMVNIQVI